jgi:hypothetical protein
MALMIVGTVFLVRRDQKISQYNDSITPYHVQDTVRVDTLTKE